ncbi:hypothetical protein Q6A90_07445 [Aliarcobacter skirrowii]|uniref:hypothetical protein n=1 Tax=Aliarcobacter skirrowii TaxID=28200 RepID=UPI0029A0ACA3|nr:hypothetical protein [Aliarcobacter skirrowii]MDX4062202.1 hypothetical protein [Aliarcobacter skirrowii]
MNEKIESIILLKTEILGFARELDTKDRKLIENLFKVLESYQDYTFEDDDINALTDFITKISEKHDDIKQIEFKQKLLKLINAILEKLNVSIDKEDNNSSALESEIQSFEKKFNTYIPILNEIKDVSTYYEDVHENMVSLDQKLEDVSKKEKILKSIKEYNEQEIAKNNFNLLSSGFASILGEKKTKLAILSWLLIGFGLLILLIPTLIICAELFHWKILFYSSSIIALTTIELFIIYYFKIFLHNYNEVKEQILQIDNKQALLGFISNYLKFKDMNSITDSSIERLEEIIFSRISPDIKQSPTAPDFASIIDKIIKAIKGNS